MRNLRAIVEDFIMEYYDHEIKDLNNRRYSSEVCEYLRTFSQEELAEVCRKSSEILDSIELYRDVINVLS